MAAYAQFGYSYPTASQLLVSGQPTTTNSGSSPVSGSLSPGGSAAGGLPGGLSPGGTSSTGGGGAQCCESGRPLMTDPVTGQSVCSCQYDSARLAALQYRNAGVGVYGAPYPSTEQNPYPSIGVESSAFYSPLSNPYALKDASGATDMSAWTSAGLQPTTGYYPYDPTLAAYGYGAGYDLAARRKNATRESTATLKAWLNEHKKNPYPTKGEKIMLAIITKMTLTQVSTWFANARRRLKKENKMTWEPRNRVEDDDNNNDDDDNDRKSTDGKDILDSKDSGTASSEDGDRPSHHHPRLMAPDTGSEWSESRNDSGPDSPEIYDHRPPHPAYLPPRTSASPPQLSTSAAAIKPRIWSLADMASKESDAPHPSRLVPPLGLHSSPYSRPHEFYRGLYGPVAQLETYQRTLVAAHSPVFAKAGLASSAGCSSGLPASSRMSPSSTSSLSSGSETPIKPVALNKA